MTISQHRAVISQPINRVFAYLADGRNNVGWQPNVLSVRRLGGNDLGAIWAQTMRLPGGIVVRDEYRITDWNIPRRLEFDVVKGLTRAHGTFTLSALAPNSTEVLFQLEERPTGLRVLLTPLLAGEVDREAAAIGNLNEAMSLAVAV